MKRFLLHIILFILVLPAVAQAQIVPIQDLKFRDYLAQNFSSVLDANQNLITYKASLIQEPINCANLGIENLEGIQYFRNISALNCSGNALKSIPEIPELVSLEELNCSNNQLTALPSLEGKGTLRKIIANNNNLKLLPSLIGLLNLEDLTVNNNQLTVLPLLVDNIKLKRLFVYDNQLTSLPSLSANTRLTELACHSNQLTSIPSLTSNTSLMHLDCGDNLLTEMPLLTYNIQLYSLACFSNRITALPPLNHLKRLTYLFCQENQLTELPSLDGLDSLSFLSCKKNQLTELPSMVGCARLYTIEADSNRIKSIPAFDAPSSLRHLFLAGNELESLPALSPEMNTLDLRYNYLSFEDLLPLNPAGSINQYQLFPQRALPLGDPIQLDEGETKVFELGFDRQVAANKYYWSDNGIALEGTIDGNYTLNKAMKLSVVIKNDLFPNDSLTTSTLLVFVNSCVNKNCDEFVLSPNGDGEGDDYYCDVTGTIEIMNREGRIVKTLTGPAKWTGEGHPTGYFLVFVNGKRVAALTLVR